MNELKQVTTQGQWLRRTGFVAMFSLFATTNSVLASYSEPIASVHKTSFQEAGIQPAEQGKPKQVRHPLPSAAEIRQLPPDGGPEFNRLIHEKSPYLLQHARNPVDWHPWGEEAFLKATEEDKPVFLSIGYSTCHWCHVMEHESFEDEEVANLLNEHFICVKVDREERPDIDQVYMTVTQQLTGSGGWPMTVLLTPDKRPFFAGTYFPKAGRGGRPGMLELVPALAAAWKNRRSDVLRGAEEIVAALGRANTKSTGDAPSETTLNLGFEQLAVRYDSKWGGFGTAPKFPSSHNYRFLLRYAQSNPETDARQIVEHSLQAMRRGGIFDHVGFGFHRYSTDRQWLLPHFEKMLYDQAMLVIAYVEAAQATEDTIYEKVARETCSYVLRDMTSPEGGFYSAEDADSEGEEGVFYLWTKAELCEVLGEEDGNLAARVYNVIEGGNFLDQATGAKTGSCILYLSEDLDRLAQNEGMSKEALELKLESIRTRLYERRKGRIHPLKDDKILTDWNGLMIAALAKAARAFDEPIYSGAAARAADFILSVMRDDRGRLLKRYRGGEAAGIGLLDDYAYLICGLIDLYQATFEEKYLTAAIDLQSLQDTFFKDEKGPGYFLSPIDGEELIVRPKVSYDGALPSGNAVSALNVLRLSRLTGNVDHEAICQEILDGFSGELAQVPASMTELLLALQFALGPTREVVVVGKRESVDMGLLLRPIFAPFIPNMVVLFRPEGSGDAAIDGLAPFTRGMSSISGKATAYVCKDFQCLQPTADLEVLRAALETQGK